MIAYILTRKQVPYNIYSVRDNVNLDPLSTANAFELETNDTLISPRQEASATFHRSLHIYMIALNLGLALVEKPMVKMPRRQRSRANNNWLGLFSFRRPKEDL
jgi:hypothetical protein